MQAGMMTNAKDLAAAYHYRAQRMRTTMRESNKHNARMLKRKAREYSGLTCHSLADLRRMGHPYATRAPNPPHPAYMIHIQSGGFRAKWYARTRVRGDDYILEFGNASGELAEWLERGTTKMIPRPIMATIIRETQDEMQMTHRRAYRAALGLHGAAARSRTRKYLSGLQ